LVNLMPAGGVEFFTDPESCRSAAAWSAPAGTRRDSQKKNPIAAAKPIKHRAKIVAVGT
jgi:hypothetical protein